MPDYDVIIAGAGIIGLATGLKVLERNPKAMLLIIEKESGPARHQSGHNSGVIHSGVYYKPGSLKAENCIRGYEQLTRFCKRENVKYEISGKVIVASNESELDRLDKIYERGIANGLNKIRKIRSDELKEIEPHAGGIEAIHVPYTGIVDFKAVTVKFAELIQNNGGEIKYNEKITNVLRRNASIEAVTQNRSFTSKVFINCCGLYSDEVALLTEKNLDTRIIPFKGEYYKLKPEKRHLVKNLIYPVPDPAFPFLGVHFTRQINGEVEAGPNAVLSFKKEGYTKTSFSLSDTFNTITWGGFYKIASKYYKTGVGEFYRSFSKTAFVKALQKLVPKIQYDDLIEGGAGVRAQAINREGNPVDDFIIHDNGAIVNVLNAPSPAATSSLAIGETISNLIINKLN